VTAFRDLPATIVGELGEAAGASLMREDGASMIALCRIDTGGAPVLERGKTSAPSKSLVLPDFQAFNWRGQSACFVEIKTYAQSAHNKKFGLQVHGIPVRLFEHYRNVEKETGLRVVLGVNELDTGALILSERSITELTKFPCLCRGGCKSVNSNMHISPSHGIREMQWYFDREEFPVAYKHSDRTVQRLRDASQKLQRGHVWGRHTESKPKAKIVLSADHPRDRCDICNDCAANHKFGFVALTIEDRIGERVVCAACWVKLSREGLIAQDEAR